MMDIIQIDAGLIAHGKRTFDRYATEGTRRRGRRPAAERDTGPRAIVGAVHGCIDAGLDTQNEIESVVARATLCRHTTIRRVLDALTGGDPARHLWRRDGDRYVAHDRSPAAGAPALLLTT